MTTLHATTLATVDATGSSPDAASSRVPAVSVCIVQRNCCGLLRACLDSLFNQPQGVPFEVIVVDNGSTDESSAMVAREYPQATLIPLARAIGYARANNLAAERARGEHVLFLNNDTVVPAGTLAELVEFQDNHPDAWLVGPRLMGEDGNEQRGGRRLPSVAVFLHRTWLLRWTGLFRRAYHDYCRRGLGPDVEVLMGAALFMRRDRFTRVGRWDEDFEFGGEDMELCWRTGQCGRILRAPFIALTHHGRASTRRHISEAHVNIAAGFVKFFRKTGTPRRHLFLYKLAVTLDAPVQVLVKAGQIGWRLLRGQGGKAAKCWNDLKGIGSFLLFGLSKFWRA